MTLMHREIVQREQQGQLDEGFLSEVKAMSDGAKPRLVTVLQIARKILGTNGSQRTSKEEQEQQVDQPTPKFVQEGARW